MTIKHGFSGRVLLSRGMRNCQREKKAINGWQAGASARGAALHPIDPQKLKVRCKLNGVKLI